MRCGKRSQEAGSFANFCAEVFGYGLADIGKRGPQAEVDPFGRGGPVGQQWNILAAMVGGWRSRVATMVGRDDQQIPRAQLLVKRRKPGVEFFEGLGVAFHVVAVAVEL